MSVSTRRARILAAVGLTALVGPLALVASPAVAVPGGDELGIYANPGDTVTVEFSAQPDHYEWTVPSGVTEITVDLAAGSGASYDVNPELSPGGVGGWLTATFAVEPGDTFALLVGGAGSFGAGGTSGGPTFPTDGMRGGGATIFASATEVLAVAGGGGAGSRCIDTQTAAVCGPGGAGGYSATANGPNGTDGTSVQPAPGYSFVGTAATVTGPGTSSDTISFVSGDLGLEDIRTTHPAVPPSAEPARVDNFDIRPGLGAVPTLSSLAGGGSGYYGGGHGGQASGVNAGETDDSVIVVLASGGGGGGSGYLAESGSLVELRDNVGDGFASISYVVPEPEVVDAPELGLTLDVTSVPAGGSFTLGGAGFDPDRAYPVILNSDPVLLGTATTDADGAFAATLLVPTTVPPGDHVITVGDASIPITVTAAAAVAEGDALAFADAPELAATGPDPLAASILGALAVALLASGAAAIRASRQPSPGRQAATRVR